MKSRPFATDPSHARGSTLGRTSIFLCLFTAVIPTPASAAPPGDAAAVRVARFESDRQAAISFTFDDGLRDQLDLAVPILDRLGFKATFFVIAGRTPESEAEARAKPPGDWGGISWGELKALAAEGHEIGNHSWSHPALTRIDDAMLDHEVNHSYDVITAHLDVPPLTFCYPGNGFDARVKAAALKRHIADRESCFDFHDGPADAGTNKEVDRAIREGDWIVSITHGILNGYAAYPTLKAFESHLQYVKDHESEIWVDTFANVFRYGRERDEARLTSQPSPGKVVFTLAAPLDPKIYDQPLTVVIAATAATDARATRDGIALPIKIRPDRILVNAVPSDAPVTVTWR